MSLWIKYPAEGMALYPYSSSQPHHLLLQSGDKLEIFERCGDWVKVKCKTTSCVGICPVNRIMIFETGSSGKFDENDLLEFEEKCLLKYVFKNVLISKWQPNLNDKKILDSVKKLQNLCQQANGYSPIQKIQIRQQISVYLDDIREFLRVGKHKRREDYSVMRAHDITEKMISPVVVIEKPKANTLNATTLNHITIEYTLNHNQELKLIFSLYDIKEKNIVSVPTAFLHPACTQEIKKICFLNLSAESIQNFVIIIRAMSFTQVGKSGSWISKFIGIATEKISSLKNEEKSLFFFKKTEKPSGYLTDEQLLADDKENNKELLIVENLVPITLKFAQEVNSDTAIHVRGDNEIPTLRLPGNVSPNFSISRLNVVFQSIQLKNKNQKTRILLHILDLSTKQYVECFSRNVDKSCYQTALQRGIDLPLSEVAEIMFTTPFDIQRSYYVFEVEKISKTKTEMQTCLYSFMKITNRKGIINTTTPGKTERLLLQFTRLPKMEASDYAKIIETSGRSTCNLDGSLCVEFILSSTMTPTDPIIHEILNWRKYKESLINNRYEPGQINESEFAIFLPQIVDSLIDIITNDAECSSQFAFEFLVHTLLEVDQSRISIMKNYFDYYIDATFKVDHPNYVNIFQHLIKYIAEALPDKSSNLPEYALTRCKNCCRCLSYFLSIISSSLRLSKDIKSKLKEETFQDSVRDVFVRLGKIIENDDPKIAISKSFICRSFPMLCDIISGAFSPEENFQLITNFFNDVEKDNNSPGNMARLIGGMIKTTFFSVEENRVKLCPLIIQNLQHIKTDKFYQDIYPMIRGIFFVMMRTSSAFQIALSSLSVFFNRMVQTCRDPLIDIDISYNYFVITFIYFIEISSIGNCILLMEYKKLDFYIYILTMIQNVASSHPPLYVFYVCTIAFSKIISLSEHPEFTFVFDQIEKIVELVSGIYNAFLNFNAVDKPFYSRVFITDFEPISKLLPFFLKAVPEEARYVPSALLPLFHIYLNQKEPQTRLIVSEGFFLLMESDWKQKHNFDRSEFLIVYALDHFCENDSLCDLKILFSNTLNKFESDPDYVDIEKFFLLLDSLTSNIKEINSFDINKSNEDEISSIILSALEMGKHNKNYSIFPYFTTKLFQLHKTINNKTEAAEVLMLCASTFDWRDREIIPEGHDQPEQEKGIRKRNIIHLAATLFCESGFFEKALEVLGILQAYYKEDNIDYLMLSKVFVEQTSCYSSICNSERNILSRFYGVRFYGNKFSDYFKNGLFIYRRNGFFMNDQMLTELKEKFPDATVHSKPPSNEELENNDLNYIHVFNVKPQESFPFNPYTPPSEIMIKRCCNVDKFYSETPIRKRREGNYGEFAEWHRDIVKYRIERPFQSIVRREKVIEISPVTTISPMECAINDTNAKTLELMEKSSTYWRCLRYDLPYNKTAVSSFSMLISGIVNAAVNGGTKIFQELFLESDLKDEPANILLSQKLKEAFSDQLKAVNFSLEVHFHVMSEQYAALHQNIVESFEFMKESMKRVIGDIDMKSKATFGEIPPIDFFQ